MSKCTVPICLKLHYNVALFADAVRVEKVSLMIPVSISMNLIRKQRKQRRLNYKSKLQIKIIMEN
jgi:hypothetical protein